MLFGTKEINFVEIPQLTNNAH